MKLLTWNINGLRARWDEVVHIARTEAPDVMCLQEIKAEASQVPEPLTGLAEFHNRWHGGPKGYSGVSLHFRRERFAKVAFSIPDFDFEHRIVEGSADDGSVSAASVYVPNGGKSYEQKLVFLDALIERAKAGAGPAILCGDFNVTRTDMDLHETHRKRGGIGQRKDERRRIEALLDAKGYCDIGRALAPEDDTLFTWWPPWRNEKEKNRGWRIDYVLAPRALLERVSRCDVLKDYGTSDHAPVVVELDVSSVASS